LPHHLPNKGGENWGSGENIQASVNVNVNAPTKFEENTLNNEQNTVNGASGSTNVMAFLYRHMLQNSPKTDKEPEINIHDAFAGTMMFLTFDGGHSLPESLGTFNSILLNGPVLSGKSSTTEYEKEYIGPREETLQNFNLKYHDIPKMFNSKDTAEATQNAIDSAFAETIKLFSEVHSQRMIDE
jgi:RTX toxin RtxA